MSVLASIDTAVEASSIVRALERIRHDQHGQHYIGLARCLRKALDRGDLVSAVSIKLRAALKARSNPWPGQVFTPDWLAQAAVQRLVPGRRVVDLGAGTGALSFAAAARGFEVFAIESDPIMVEILRHLVHLLGYDDRISVVEASAFDWIGPSGCQIISNPPYTRHHQIPKDQKRELLNFARSVGINLSGSSSLYIFFMVAAMTAHWSKNEVFLVPTNWMEADYGIPLKAYLQFNHAGQIEVIQRSLKAETFEGHMTTACIVTTSRNPTGNSALWLGPFEKSGNDSYHASTDISSLQPSGNWLARYIRPTHDSSTEGTTLGDLFRVRRGLATGANDFFLFSSESAAAEGILRDELTTVIRSLTQYNRRTIRNLLWTPSDPPSKASLAHITRGRGGRDSQRIALWFQKALVATQGPRSRTVPNNFYGPGTTHGC